MSFHLTILGSGTMMPTKRRHPASYLLQIGDKKILLDVGHQTVGRLVEWGIDLHSIDMISISHFHTDHCGDLLPFVHARFVDGLYRKTPHKPLLIAGPQTLQERFKKLRDVFWVEPREEYPLEFREGPQAFTLGDVQVELFEVKHVEWFQSVGIRITQDGSTMVYTGDIGSRHSMDDLKKRAENADVLLVECAAIEPAPNHFTIEQVIEVTKEAKVKKTIVTHVRDIHLPHIEPRIAEHPNIILAEDGMKVEG